MGPSSINRTKDQVKDVAPLSTMESSGSWGRENMVSQRKYHVEVLPLKGLNPMIFTI